MNALLGKTSEEIERIVDLLSAPSFVAKQICSWIYSKGVNDISQMSNISLQIREKLSKDYCVGQIPYKKEVISQDGTRKYLFVYEGGVLVEAVLIFDGKRTTLCISSQAGCKMNCGFCATGKMGFSRNLTSHEIINIYQTLNTALDTFYKGQKIDNIVFMGMGEPLDNLEEVKKTLEILTAKWGYALSPHRITVSTCGLLPKMREFLNSTQCDVAISLHNAISEERQQMMPIEKAFPVAEVVKILKEYDWKGQRHLTFEYIVFKNLNDSAKHINAIARLLNGLPCRINLIPFNNVPNTPFVGVSKEDMMLFAAKLKAKGFNTTVRQSKGADISAACGLLSAKERL